MIHAPTTHRRRITVTLGPGRGPTAPGSARTVSCLSPSYSSAVATVLTRVADGRPVRVFAIGEAQPHGEVRIRRRWPGGIDARSARTAAADLDVNCDDPLRRP